MATTKTIQPTGETINLPEMTDRPDMSVVSTSLGKVVDAVNSDNASLIKTEEALAIISTGNTHGAINAGQYVYVRAHSTLAEGLYLASANVAANGTLSGSNVTEVSGGGLNALNSKTATPNSYAVVSLDEVKATLNTVLSSMAVGEVRNIRISLNQSFEPFKGSVWLGTVSKNESARHTAFFQGTSNNFIQAQFGADQVWTFEPIALNSKIANALNVVNIEDTTTSDISTAIENKATEITNASKNYIVTVCISTTGRRYYVSGFYAGPTYYALICATFDGTLKFVCKSGSTQTTKTITVE